MTIHETNSSRDQKPEPWTGMRKYSDDIFHYSRPFIRKKLLEIFDANPQRLNLRALDVAGGDSPALKTFLGDIFSIDTLEIEENNEAENNLIDGDIRKGTKIKNNTYDLVYSNGFQHLKEPWSVAEECTRVLKPGGAVLVFSPFSWRFHPMPVDMYRFSHEGLAYLFERTGKIESRLRGYDLSKRRNDIRGFWENNRDYVPIDDLGGFRENWMAIYLGKKIEKKKSNALLKLSHLRMSTFFRKRLGN
jgi:SAM-dependent methyltransferase